MEAKPWSKIPESHQACNGYELAKQREVTRSCGIQLLYVNVSDRLGERDMSLSREDLRGSNPNITNRKKSAEVVLVKKLL